MARPLRIEYAGALYYIASRGNVRENIYWSDADKREFLEVFSQSLGRVNMNNKLYELPDPCDFSLAFNNSGDSSDCTPKLTPKFSNPFRGGG